MSTIVLPLLQLLMRMRCMSAELSTGLPNSSSQAQNSGFELRRCMSSFCGMMPVAPAYWNSTMTVRVTVVVFGGTQLSLAVISTS